jgi:threonyl-tRNA synthetase
LLFVLKKGNMEINKELNQLGALLLAKSAIDLYPDAQLANYQVSEDGFKYNIKFVNSFSINELNKLKKQMTKNIDRAYEIKYESISKAEALKIFKNDSFRKELINDSKETTFCIARFGNDFVDMCPKLAFNKLSVIKAISLINVAGEYWKGNSKNEQLTTITGVVFESESSLKEFSEMMADRKERDHRRIGQDLELFTFSNLAGQGLPI